jgi:hypothetical protein
MTFRELLKNCDPEKVGQWIGRPHLGGEGASPAVLVSLIHDYGKVIETLLHLPVNERRYRLAVRRRDAPRDDEFITWLYNPDCDGRQKALGLMAIPWKHLIDAEVLHSKGLPAEVVVAEVLLQVTILGFEGKTQEEIDAALKAFAQDAVDSLTVFGEV